MLSVGTFHGGSDPKRRDLSRGYGAVQRQILVQLTEGEWTSLRELSDGTIYGHIESARRAVHKLEAAGVVETMLRKGLTDWAGVQTQLYVRWFKTLEALPRPHTTMALTAWTAIADEAVTPTPHGSRVGRLFAPRRKRRARRCA
jgi:hypothetical protein